MTDIDPMSLWVLEILRANILDVSANLSDLSRDSTINPWKEAASPTSPSSTATRVLPNLGKLAGLRLRLSLDVFDRRADGYGTKELKASEAEFRYLPGVLQVSPR
jgi:hypothetical protein